MGGPELEFEVAGGGVHEDFRTTRERQSEGACRDVEGASLTSSAALECRSSTWLLNLLRLWILTIAFHGWSIIATREIGRSFRPAEPPRFRDAKLDVLPRPGLRRQGILGFIYIIKKKHKLIWCIRDQESKSIGRELDVNCSRSDVMQK